MPLPTSSMSSLMTERCTTPTAVQYAKGLHPIQNATRTQSQELTDRAVSGAGLQSGYGMQMVSGHGVTVATHAEDKIVSFGIVATAKALPPFSAVARIC